MIKSFRCKHTEKDFLREPVSKFSQDMYRKALRKLLIIDAAEQLIDLKEPPENQLEKLSGDRRNHSSIRINEKWRICFRRGNGDALEIESVDYH